MSVIKSRGPLFTDPALRKANAISKPWHLVAKISLYADIECWLPKSTARHFVFTFYVILFSYSLILISFRLHIIMLDPCSAS